MPKFGLHQSPDANFSLADITYTERCFCFSANNTLPSTTRAHIIIIIWWTPERGGLTTFPSRHRLGQQVGLLIRAWNRYKTMGPLTICYSSPKHRTASVALVAWGWVGAGEINKRQTIGHDGHFVFANYCHVPIRQKTWMSELFVRSVEWWEKLMDSVFFLWQWWKKNGTFNNLGR